MASDQSGTLIGVVAQQACAVPFRRRKNRQIEFCLITSSRGRWLFPKGCIGRGSSPIETALQEAYEEAGLHGKIVGDPLGCYVIPKNGDKLSIIALLMEVKNSDRSWPEGAVRQRRWVTAGKARRVLNEPQLAEILGTAVARLKGKTSPSNLAFAQPFDRA